MGGSAKFDTRDLNEAKALLAELVFTDNCMADDFRYWQICSLIPGLGVKLTVYPRRDMVSSAIGVMTST